MRVGEGYPGTGTDSDDHVHLQAYGKMRVGEGCPGLRLASRLMDKSVLNLMLPSHIALAVKAFAGTCLCYASLLIL